MPGIVHRGEVVESEITIARKTDLQTGDPDTLTFWVKPPSSEPVSYVYGVQGPIQRDDTGNYRASYSTSAASGEWEHGWFGVGEFEGAVSRTIIVIDSNAPL